MSLPTKAEIAELEQELGFPFRTAHFTNNSSDDEDSEPGDACFYRGDIMEADLKQLPVEQRRLSQFTLDHQQAVWTHRNNLAEDRHNEQVLAYNEKDAC